MKNIDDRTVNSLIVEFTGLFLNLKKHHETPVFARAGVGEWISLWTGFKSEPTWDDAADMSRFTLCFFLMRYKSLSRHVC